MRGRVCVWPGGVRGGGACVAGETAAAVGGTHPTRMHSCLVLNSAAVFSSRRTGKKIVLCSQCMFYLDLHEVMRPVCACLTRCLRKFYFIKIATGYLDMWTWLRNLSPLWEA